MPRQRINLDAGVVGMGEPGEVMTGENLQAYDGGLEATVDDADVLRDEHGKKLYVRLPHRIDRKMVKAGYVPLTPAICNVCGTKLVKNYSKLSQGQKDMVKMKLAEHKAALHKISNATVIDEDAMKENRSWLGVGRQ